MKRDPMPKTCDHHASRLLSSAIRLHRQLLDWSLAKPLWLAGISVLLVAGAWAGYQVLGIRYAAGDG